MVKKFNLKGKSVFFAGDLSRKTKKQAEQDAKEFGAVIHSNITSSTQIVVEGLAAEDVLQQAKDLNLNIYTEKEWLDRLKTVNTNTGTKHKLHGISGSESEGEDEEPAKKKQKPETSTASSTQTSQATSKPKCQYWGKCYRKNAAHLKQYLHPSDENKLNNSSNDDAEILPKNKMADGETVDIQRYRIKYTGNHYYCTCPGWRLQNAAVTCRTCKHLKEYLGEEFEAERIKQNGGTPASSKARGKHTAAKNANARKPGSKQIPQVLLAHKFTENINPKGWWMSEKLDGVRAYWDGKTFYSRQGNEFVPPDWFIEGLPTDAELDGELFGGRKQFQSTVSIVKSPESVDWKKLKYHIFDAPGKGSQKFEKRMEYLESYFAQNEVPYATVVVQTLCKGQQHVDQELQAVQGKGGEGLMLREPKSRYEHCRSNTLLKVKTFYDAEAKVIKHETGSGRNSHRMGALRCKMECGKLFSVGSGFTDAQRNKPPKIGSIIVYKFQELTNSGAPRFPTFVGEAADKSKPKDAILPETNVE